MHRYRLSIAAQEDIHEILTWSHDRFGEGARIRYEALVVAALRDVADQPGRPGSIERPELGAGTRSWHLGLSRGRAGALARIRHPRHFLIYLMYPYAVAIFRVMHYAMELALHMDPAAWE